MSPTFLGNGRYELAEFISKGGMGAVYRAMDQELGRWVALKCLHDTDNENSRDLALKEARTLASLNHPNILRVYDVLTVNDQIWIVSEWLEGRCLTQLRKPVSPASALAIVTQVFSALAAAHEAQVIHRDVKPANIMLGNDGRITLIDFGVAFAPGNSTGQTIVGSLRYTDPRILEGQHPDAHSDLFSTALVLAELLTGETVLPDLAPLPLYRHIKKNLSYKLDSVLDGIYPPAASLVRKFADVTRLDELHFSTPAREAALLSQDYFRKLSQANPDEYLSSGVCENNYSDPQADLTMAKEAADAVASLYLSPKQKSGWIAFSHNKVTDHNGTAPQNGQRTDFSRRVSLIAKQAKHVFRRKGTVLNSALAAAVIIVIVVWMMKSNIIKKTDYQKSHALNDLIDSEKNGNVPNVPPQQAVGTSVTAPDFTDDKSGSKNVGELDRSALVRAPNAKEEAERAQALPVWNVVLDQPGILVINGREYGTVKTKDVNLAFGVHVFEVRRSGKPTSQFTIALSNDTPKKISVK